METYATKFLGKSITVKIDRAKRSKHPKHDYIYPINYGYIPNTKAPDGHEVDVYVLGVDTPIESFEGICIAIIHRTNDDDDKCIIVPEGTNFSDVEIKKQTYFQEQFFTSVIVREP